MKVAVLLCLCLSGVALGEAPYPESGWKPSGALLVLPSSARQAAAHSPNPDNAYGPPLTAPLPSFTTQPPPASDNTQGRSGDANANLSVVEKLKQQTGSDSGVYYVFLPSGRLQKVEYATAPLKDITVRRDSSESQQQYNTPAQFDLPPQFNRQQPNPQPEYSNQYSQFQTQPQNRQAGDSFGQEQAAQQSFDELQRRYLEPSASRQASFGQERPADRAQLEPRFAARQSFSPQSQDPQQSTNEYLPPAQSGSGQAFGQRTPQDHHQPAAAQSRNSFGSFPAPPQDDYSQQSDSNQQQRKETAETKEPHPVIAQFGQLQIQMMPEPLSNYVASIQYSDVPPINAPIYSYNSAPVARILRK